jgi:hypothetical protein
MSGTSFGGGSGGGTAGGSSASGGSATDGSRGSGVVRVYGAQWGPDDGRRPGLPWIGVFLVVFGVLLFLEKTFPEYRNLGNITVLAAGLASLVVWLLRRSSVALYAGAFLTALAVPGTFQGLGLAVGPGFGTLCFGLALLFIAAVRASERGGWGWQAFWGSILTLLGASQVVVGTAVDLLLPALLVVLGLFLLVRNRAA